MTDVFALVLLRLVQLLMLAILAQVILSWLVVLGVQSPFIFNLYRAVTMINEPIMRPLRRVIPNFGMIDLTPMIAIIVLAIISQVIAETIR